MTLYKHISLRKNIVLVAFSSAFLANETKMWPPFSKSGKGSGRLDKGNFTEKEGRVALIKEVGGARKTSNNNIQFNKNHILRANRHNSSAPNQST